MKLRCTTQERENHSEIIPQELHKYASQIVGHFNIKNPLSYTFSVNCSNKFKRKDRASCIVYFFKENYITKTKMVP